MEEPRIICGEGYTPVQAKLATMMVLSQALRADIRLPKIKRKTVKPDGGYNKQKENERRRKQMERQP